jgi:integrase
MELTLRQVLSRPDSQGRCRIVLDVTWESQREKLPTGVRCLPAHFAPTALRVVSPKDPDAARLNAVLNTKLAAVRKAILKATADEVPLTKTQLHAALGRPPKTAGAAPAAPVLVTAADFHAAWLAENPGQAASSARRYQQVVAHLDAYRAAWPVTQLTRADFLAYLHHAAGLGLVDSTVIKHVKFLRECFRLAGLPVPAWLKMQVRYGRSPALQAAELRQLLALPLFEQDALEQERDLFLLQTLLLLRDSDLRQLRPHHVAELELPGAGRVLVMSIRQAKTGDEVRLPLPPLAAAIWRKYGGVLPVTVQQYRNRHMKLLMERAGLTRPFVRVRYVQGAATEEVVPLWQVITTHTARHTGADMVMLGSGGDSNLKEKALGHAGVYGHDALERYGPLLLQAWETVLGAKPENAPKRTQHNTQNAPKLTGGGMVFQVIKRP